MLEILSLFLGVVILYLAFTNYNLNKENKRLTDAILNMMLGKKHKGK
jgi:hypothetical protein